MGDLLAYLEEVSQPPAHYTGVDALPSLIAEAKRRYSPDKVAPTKPITPTEFVVGDLVAKPGLFATGSPEIVVISGMLNTLAEAEFFATVDRAFAAAQPMPAVQLPVHPPARGKGRRRHDRPHGPGQSARPRLFAHHQADRPPRLLRQQGLHYGVDEMRMASSRSAAEWTCHWTSSSNSTVFSFTLDRASIVLKNSAEKSGNE